MPIELSLREHQSLSKSQWKLYFQQCASDNIWGFRDNMHIALTPSRHVKLDCLCWRENWENDGYGEYTGTREREKDVAKTQQTTLRGIQNFQAQHTDFKELLRKCKCRRSCFFEKISPQSGLAQELCKRWALEWRFGCWLGLILVKKFTDFASTRFNLAQKIFE